MRHSPLHCSCKGEFFRLGTQGGPLMQYSFIYMTIPFRCAASCSLVSDKCTKVTRPNIILWSRLVRSSSIFLVSLRCCSIRQFIHETAGNFYSSDNGKKGVKRKKSGASGLNNQAEVPL